MMEVGSEICSILFLTVVSTTRRQPSKNCRLRNPTLQLDSVTKCSTMLCASSMVRTKQQWESLKNCRREGRCELMLFYGSPAVTNDSVHSAKQNQRIVKQ